MAVFRVERTRDYTTMSNYHLRDTELSLKAKGLLSIMLSLPDSWNYTTRGLAAICKEGVDAIRSAIKELETSGYIVRRLLRGENGRIADTEYIIFERPQDNMDMAPSAADPQAGEPDAPSPYPGNPYAVEPSADEPPTKKATQLNIDRENKDQSKTDLSRLTEGNARAGAASGEAAGADGSTEQAVRLARERIRAQIEYGCITNVENREQVDEFVEIMLEASLTESPTIRIGREREYPTAFVRERFALIDSSHIERLLDAILENKTQVRNTKAYLLAALFDAPASKENHYTMRVNGGW